MSAPPPPPLSATPAAAASSASGSPSSTSLPTSTTPSTSASTTQAPTYIFSTPSITTTFKPPPECTEGHITMLERQQYFIWENEPLPVPNSTFSECYPPQFMTSYLQSYSSTIAPAFSPLVCPDNYQTIFSQAMTNRPMYIACCPSNYGLHPPDTSTPGRPAFGGTCYSNILSVSVTQYDNSSSSGVMLFSTSGQAYAHPIDGFALEVSSTANSTNGAALPAASGTVTPVNSADQPQALSGGAIAGIVVGAVAGLAILLLAIVFLCARRRRNIPMGTDPNQVESDRFGGPPRYSQAGPWLNEKALPPRPQQFTKHAELSTTPRFAPFQELPDHNAQIAMELDSNEPMRRERSAWIRDPGGRTPNKSSATSLERSTSASYTETMFPAVSPPENSISPISAADR